MCLCDMQSNIPDPQIDSVCLMSERDSGSTWLEHLLVENFELISYPCAFKHEWGMEKVSNFLVLPPNVLVIANFRHDCPPFLQSRCYLNGGLFDSSFGTKALHSATKCPRLYHERCWESLQQMPHCAKFRGVLPYCFIMLITDSSYGLQMHLLHCVTVPDFHDSQSCSCISACRNVIDWVQL